MRGVVRWSEDLDCVMGFLGGAIERVVVFPDRIVLGKVQMWLGYTQTVLHGARRTPAAVPAAGASKNHGPASFAGLIKEK